MTVIWPEAPDQMVVAFDLDDTLARGCYPSPEIGQPIPLALEGVAYYAGLGYEILVYTARPESHKQRIWEWLEQHGIRWMIYDIHCGKPRAGVYIDDKAVAFPGGLRG